ncbi:UNVERIFIED_CONTAM: hypothetical protein DES50_12317 [Williamsia faeni]
MVTTTDSAPTDRLARHMPSARAGVKAATIALLVAVISLLLPAGTAHADDDSNLNKACQAVTSAPIDLIPGVGDITSGIKDLACTAGTEGAGAAAEKLYDSAFGKVVEDMLAGAAEIVKVVLTWWMKIPLPDLYGEGGGPNQGLITKINEYTVQTQVFLAALSFLVVITKVGMARAHAAGEEVREANKSLIRVIFTVATLPTVIVLASKGGDTWAIWIVNKAAGDGGIEKAITKLLMAAAFGPGIMFFIAAAICLTGLLQAAMFVVRTAFLILVCAALPVAASASGGSTGKQTYDKLIAWTIAFLLFKPVAGMCMAVAIWAGADDSDPMSQLAGMFLLMMSFLTLPALMRLIAPAVSSVGNGPSTVGAIGGAVAGGAAIGSLKGSMTSSGKGGAGGSSGATNVTSGPPTGATNTRSDNTGGGKSTKGGTGSSPASTSGGPGGSVPAVAGKGAAGAHPAAAAATVAAGSVAAGAKAIDRAAEQGSSTDNSSSGGGDGPSGSVGGSRK